MDLGIVVPAAVTAAIEIRRGAPWATKAMFVIIGWAGLLGSAVAGMAVVMQVNDHPAASPTNTAVFVTFTRVFVGLAVGVLCLLFGNEGGEAAGRRLDEGVGASA